MGLKESVALLLLFLQGKHRLSLTASQGGLCGTCQEYNLEEGSMKKSQYMALGFSVVLALSMAGCGGQTAPEPQEPKQEVQQVAEPISTETPAPPIESGSEAELEDMEPIEVQTEEAEDNAEAAPVEEEQTVELFTEVNETVYATGAVNLRSGPGTTFDKVGSLATGDSATRTGIGTGEAENWSRVMLDSGNVVYVSSNFLSLTKPAVQQAQPVNASSGGSGGSGSTQASDQSDIDSSGSYDFQQAVQSQRGHLDFGDQKLPGINGLDGATTEGWTAIYR